MFVRVKKSGKYEYLKVVHNYSEGKKVRQDVIATLGRLDVLMKTGQIDRLMASCAGFAQRIAVVDATRRGKTPPADTIHAPGVIRRSFSRGFGGNRGRRR